jgi:hypothetical protein
MLRAHLRDQGTKTHYGVGLLLLVLSPIYYARLSPGLNVSVAISVVCLAGVSCVFALLQDRLTVSSSVKALLPWLYGLGTILTLSSWPWLQNLLAVWAKNAEWRRTLGMMDLVFPGMILLPVGIVFVGVLCSNRKRPGRVYLLSGLCLVALSIGKLWFNLFNIHFAATSSSDSFMAGLLWTPVCLVVATTGMILGCVPHELHPSSRLRSAVIHCYLLGVALVPLGFYASMSDHETLAYTALLVIMIGVFAPASLATRGWITSRRRPLS